MKKCISKIMLILSILFGAMTVFMMVYCVAEPVGRSSRISITLALLVVCGLFLGLYRVIDLLEEK